jgi:hypothetical protein
MAAQEPVSAADLAKWFSIPSHAIGFNFSPTCDFGEGEIVPALAVEWATPPAAPEPDDGAE